MSSALRWLMVLFVAAATVLLGAAAHADPTQPCVLPTCPASTTTTTLQPTTTTSSTTLPPGVGATPNPYSASFSPCTSDGSQSGTAPCNETPQQIQVLYPAGPPPAEIEFNWDTSGRSSAAPSPQDTSVTLTYDPQTNNCGVDLACWAWPSGMTDGSYILNGTYQVVPCPYGYVVGGSCNDPDPLPPQSIGLAVPPGPPASVDAHPAGSEVTIQWQAPDQMPPDLAGYYIDRNGATVYTCSTDDLGPGANVPCPSDLEVADHPGDGEYTYSVTAMRLGVDSAADDVVSSSAVEDGSGVITVSGTETTSPSTSDSGSGSTSVGLGSGPGSGGNSTAGSNGSGSTNVGLSQVSAAAQPTAAGISAPIPKLSYPTSPELAPKHPQSLALKVVPSSNHNDVVPVAVLALGILSLAVAAHFLYLRVELGEVQARLAARRTAGI
jgi:hypothetical protein